MTSRMSPTTAAREDLYELFHDHWNLLTAVNSYAMILQHSVNVNGVDKEAAEELSRLVPLLEQSMEAIRVRALSQLG